MTIANEGNMSASTVPTPAEPAALSPLQRIINIFVAPSTVFADLRRDTSWWAAWVLISVFSLLFVYAMQTKVGFDQITKNEIAANSKAQEQLEKASPERREQQMAAWSALGKYLSWGSPILALVIVAVISAVLLATFNFGFGTEIKFGTAYAVVMWGWMPSIMRALLASISLFAGADPEAFNAKNPVACNLGFFINRVDHPALFSLLSSVDIISIGICILLAIGFSTVSKTKRSSAMSVVFGWYVLVSLFGAGWTAVFS